MELREELNKSQDQVVNLNCVIAERISEVEKLSTDIDSLKRENEVRNNVRFCICYFITLLLFLDEVYITLKFVY